MRSATRPQQVIKDFDLSLRAKFDSNACAVYSLAAVFDITYDKAWDFAKKVFKREHRKGTPNMQTTIPLLCAKKKQLGNKIFFREVPCTKFYKSYGDYIPRQMTVSTFVKKYPKGRYLVLVKGHAFALVDGQIIDSSDIHYKSKRRVTVAWEVRDVDSYNKTCLDLKNLTSLLT